MGSRDAYEKRVDEIPAIFMQLDKYGGSFWEDAACRDSGDPDAWFVDYGSASDIDVWRLSVATQICETCPIKARCLEAGMDQHELNWGLWGGLLPGERILLKLRGTGKNPGRVERMKIHAARVLRQRIVEIKKKGIQ